MVFARVTAGLGAKLQEWIFRRSSRSPAKIICWFESLPLTTRKKLWFSQKILTFSRQYGNEGYGKCA